MRFYGNRRIGINIANGYEFGFNKILLRNEYYSIWLLVSIDKIIWLMIIFMKRYPKT